MIDKKKDAADSKQGEFVYNCVKQGWGAVNKFGKGISESVLEKKEIIIMQIEI